MNGSEKIKILVAYHKEAPIIENEIFIPIQLGRKISTHKLKMIGDDTGENISELNPQFSELTAVYWAWKNLNDDSDYIGLCHFRRFPSFLKIPIVKLFPQITSYIIYWLGNVIKPGANYIFWPKIHCSSIVEANANIRSFTKELKTSRKFDMYVLNNVKYSGRNIAVNWSIEISYNTMTIFEEILKTKHQFIWPYYSELSRGNKINPCNIFILERKIFMEYSEWIFSVLFELTTRIEKDNIIILPRTIGYLGEILTSLFIIYKNKNQATLKKMNLMQLDFLF